VSAESLERLRQIALVYLGRRERTVAEMRHRLEREGADETAIDQVVSELTADLLLDDARYARLFVEDKRSLEGWGSERIERELRQRGVDRDLIGAALAPAGDEESELDRALALLRRRFPDPPRDRRSRDRALGVLVRKGYESEVALDALSAHARGREANA
jgi:regulatory protein